MHYEGSSLYPDLDRVGGLSTALTIEFRKLNSQLATVVQPTGSNSAGWWVHNTKSRSANLSIALEQRLFLMNLWLDGINVAVGESDALSDVAPVFQAWFEDKVAIAALPSIFSGVTITECGEAYSSGVYIDYTWAKYLKLEHGDDPTDPAHRFLSAAAKNSVLRGLLPFTSVGNIGFSRCTGYPYTLDVCFVVPRIDGVYEVFDPAGTSLGTTDADGAVALVVSKLPKHCGLARHGTADDPEGG